MGGGANEGFEGEPSSSGQVASLGRLLITLVINGVTQSVYAGTTESSAIV